MIKTVVHISNEEELWTKETHKDRRLLAEKKWFYSIEYRTVKKSALDV
jgi:hypothetical protein